MYFFDAQDFAFPKGSATSNLLINWQDTWYSHYYMNDFVFVNNTDGTLGVYYDPNYFTGTTDTIQNFSSQISEEYCKILNNKFEETRNELITSFYNGYSQVPDCYRIGHTDTCASERFATFFQSYGVYPSIPNCYWDKRRNTCATKSHPMGLPNQDGTFSSACCDGDSSLDYTTLMTKSLSDVTTVEDFEYYLSSELIDVKSRKVLSGYPTLRALYDRYTNSADYCPTTSSAFDYEQIDQFAHLIDSYWVDIVEQVVPATTIWGSVKIYGNTMFDQQKFEYKRGSLLTCMAGPCSLDNLEFLNACMNNIIDTFYTDECPCEVTGESVYYFGDE